MKDKLRSSEKYEVFGRGQKRFGEWERNREESYRERVKQKQKQRRQKHRERIKWKRQIENDNKDRAVRQNFEWEKCSFEIK